MSIRPLFTLLWLPVAWLHFATAPLAAQLPKLPGITSPSSADQAGTAPATEVPSAANLADELAKTQAKLADPRVPEGISEAELSAYRSDLRSTVFNLERQIGLKDTSADSEAGSAPPKPDHPPGAAAQPPFSFLAYDQLRDARDDEAAKLAAQHASVRLLQGLMDHQRERLRAANAASQTAAEDLTRNLKGPGEAAALWRLEAARTATQAAASAIAYLQIRRDGLQPRIDRTAAALEQLGRDIAAMAPQVKFSEEDLAAANRNTTERMAQLDREFAELTHKRKFLLDERDRLKRESASLNETAPGSGNEEPQARSATLAKELAVIEAELGQSTSGMELIAVLGRIHTEIDTALKDVRQILHGATAQERATAATRLLEARSLAQSWLTFAASQRAANHAAIREHEAALATTGANSADYAAATRILAATVRNGGYLERMEKLAAQATRKLDRWIADGEEILARRSLGQRVSDTFAAVWTAVKAVWAFPVYRYSDTVEVGGQTIKVSRGLSFGRLLGALVFLVLAHFVAVFIIRRTQRALTQRQWGDAAQFPTFRRWTMVALDSLLVLFTLHLLEIPLTAFAFLGGALAIGFGFGTQTIFKNLISGVIVLGERNIKVGDILEVDGFIGRVTSVDTRSSTLRGFDGVETLVPNSMLLESRVTNWTMSNPRQRRMIRVGVAYGSPLQRATAILEDCAERHGLVLKDPDPLVMLEDFAADAILLGLYFWVELKESTNANLIASDLRFMIEKRFTEAGIVISFPQRDVHLTAPAPIPVRMVADAPPGTPSPTPDN